MVRPPDDRQRGQDRHYHVGLAAGPINPVLLTVYQDRTPPWLRGRVFGLLTAIAWSVLPLGRLIGGYLIEWIGLRVAVGATAAGYLAVGLVAFVVPVFAMMESRNRGSGPYSH